MTWGNKWGFLSLRIKCLYIVSINPTMVCWPPLVNSCLVVAHVNKVKFIGYLLFLQAVSGAFDLGHYWLIKPTSYIFKHRCKQKYMISMSISSFVCSIAFESS